MGVITLNDKIKVDYLVGVDSTLTPTEITDVNKYDFIPSWETFENTEIMCPFEEDIHSSYINGLRSPLTGFLIYRQKKGETRLHKVAEVNSKTLHIIDYLISNQRDYQYIVLPLTDTEIGVSLLSNPIHTDWSSWSLTSIKQTADNVFIPTETWSFSLNLSPAEMKHNIEKKYMNGYSKYSKVAVGETDYIDGSITCLLGNLSRDTDEYDEDIDKVYAWREFCARGEECILKDTKGNIFRVHIDNLSSSQFCTATGLPTQITFKFTQTGSIDNMTVFEEV